jgi:hypothetical protein
VNGVILSRIDDLHHHNEIGGALGPIKEIFTDLTVPKWFENGDR